MNDAQSSSNRTAQHSAGRSITQIQAERYGAPDVLIAGEGWLAAPASHEVTIATRAIGVNAFDAKVLAGAFGKDQTALPIVPGLELSGVVIAIGADVAASAAFAVGDEVVLAPTSRAFASAVNADASQLLRKPAELSFEQAAGLLVVGGTAAQLVAAAELDEGDTVLIHGASGGVGRIAAQLAISAGARVIGTASDRHHEQLRALGVEPVAYGPGLEARVRDLAPNGVAAAIDTVGNDEAVDVSLALVDAPSRVFTIAGFARLDTGIVAIDGRPDQPAAAVRSASRVELLGALAAGRLEFPIAATFPLADAAQALELVASGRAGGKVLLVPDEA